MNIPRRTAVLASAYLLVAASGVSQPRNSSTPQSVTSNFYITTPQTGQQTAVGTSQRAAATSSQQQQNARSAVANTYLSQTTWQVPASTEEQARSQRQSARSPQVRQQQSDAYIRQVSNPASATSVRQATANYYTNTRTAGGAVSAARSQSTQRTAAAQVPNYYYQQSAQQAQNTAPAASQQQKRGFFSRIFNHQHSDHASHRGPIDKVGHAATRVREAVSYRASKLNGRIQQGVASWYGKDFDGGPTASGEKYNMNSMTAAHKTLPFGTMVKVRNERNGRECVVRINNRGPFTKGRILDLSHAAARKLDMVGSGIAKIKMEVIGRS